MVLKQGGHDAMTFFPVPAPTPAPLRVSMFWAASIWKTNSLPSRRAGSPVQGSAGATEAELGGPGGAAVLGQAPGVAAALEVVEHGRGLGGERGLDQDLVA